MREGGGGWARDRRKRGDEVYVFVFMNTRIG